MTRLWQAFSWVWAPFFWLAWVGVPLAFVLARGVRVQALLDPEVVAVALATVKQASWSTLISAGLGLPLGLWIGSLRRRGLPEVFLALPYGVPTVAAGTAWVAWLGRSGVLVRFGVPLDWAYSFRGVVLAHVFFNVPWIALLVSQARAEIPAVQLEAARLLGARPGRLFRDVIWPRVQPAFWSGVTQVFAVCVMSFALVMILGGGPPVQTLETALFGKVRSGSLDLSGAAACATWEILLTLLPWCLLQFLERSRGLQEAARGADRPGPPDSGFAFGAAIGLAALFSMPYAVVFFGSGWRALPEALTDILPALRISLILALACSASSVVTALTVVTVLRSLAAKRRHGLAALLFGVPSGLSVLVLALGGWLAYGLWIDPFDGILSSATLMVAVQTALFYPMVLRILWPVARTTEASRVEAARTLGASRTLAFWHVEWPRWRRPVLSAAGMVAGASLGEVAAVSLFYNEKLIPLPLLISRWMGQYRFEAAQGLTALVLLLSAGTITLMMLARGVRDVAT